jgi:hypothetical protein
MIMGTKTYDSATDLITFSRASSATFLGSNGLLQTAANNVPRIEYDATGAVKGLLIEEARTNLYLKSNQFVSPWALMSSTVTASAGTSPSGLADAYRWAGTGNAILYQNTPYVAGDYTVSAWVKSNGAGEDTFRLYGLNSNLSGDFTATSEWVRYSHTFTSPSTVNQFSGILNGASQGNVDLLVYGFQIEAGAFPTSYIPTTGAAATRARDIAEIPTSAFGYNNDKGTVVCEFDSAKLNGSTVFTLDLDGAGTENGITTIVYPANRISYQAVTVGAVQANLNFDAYATASQVSKVATVYAKDDFAAVLNGGAVATDTAASLPTVDLLRLGVYLRGASFPMSGHIKSIQYYPRRLTNTQLQELTT